MASAFSKKADISDKKAYILEIMKRAFMSACIFCWRQENQKQSWSNLIAFGCQNWSGL